MQWVAGISAALGREFVCRSLRRYHFLVRVNLMEITFDDHLWPVPKNLPLTRDEREAIGERAAMNWLQGDWRVRIAGIALMAVLGGIWMLAGWLLERFAGWSGFAAYSIPFLLVVPAFIVSVRLLLRLGYYDHLRELLLKFRLNACPRCGTKLEREDESRDFCPACRQYWRRVNTMAATGES